MQEENLNNINEETEDDTQQEQKGRFYTDEEIESLKQRVGDQRVSQAMKTLERRQRETNKLKNMTADERFQYELDQKERELEERENKLVLAENKNTCIGILNEKGLDISLVDFVVAPTADEMNANIKKLEKAFKASVKAEVEKRLAGSSPKKNFADSDALTKKDLMKMSLSELQSFKNLNPQQYNEIMGV